MHPGLVHSSEHGPLLRIVAWSCRNYCWSWLFLCLAIVTFVGGGVFYQYGRTHRWPELIELRQEAKDLCATFGCLTAGNCTAFNAAIIMFLRDEDFVALACSQGCTAGMNCSEVDRDSCCQRCRDVWNVVSQSEQKVANDGARALDTGIWLFVLASVMLLMAAVTYLQDRPSVVGPSNETV